MRALAPRLGDLDLALPTTTPFTRAQAHDAGVSDVRLHRLVAAGVLRRPVRQVYVASDAPDSIELRCKALSLAVPADAFICDRTAAWVYTGRRALAPNEHLAVPPISCFRRSGSRALRGQLVASGERAVGVDDLRELNGLVLTTELRTALDLGRLERTRDLRLWGMSNMLATGAFDHEQLLTRIPEFKGERGVVDLRVIAPRADPRLESFGEAGLLNRWHDAGLPPPELQISLEIDGVEVARLDMGLSEWLFAAEYDGEEWHSEDDDVEHDARRRSWIRRDWRYWIEVFLKAHVFGSQQNAEVRLRQAAAQSRARFGERVFII